MSILSSSPPVSKFDALTPTCRKVGSIPSVLQVERRTKIPLADTDGNPATAADPNWTPLLITLPHPDYPSGHSTQTAAAIVILAHYFGKNSSIIVDSEVSPGVVRSFSDFASAQVELNNALVYGGIHFRTACEDGKAQGTAVARFLLKNAFQRIDGDDWRDRDDDN